MKAAVFPLPIHPSGSKTFPAPASARPYPSPRSGLRCLSHRPAHLRRRPPPHPPAADPRSPDHQRSYRGRDAPNLRSTRSASPGWAAPTAPASSAAVKRKPLRQPRVHRLDRRRRLRRIRTGRADFVYPLPDGLDDFTRAAAVRRHHRLSQPSGHRRPPRKRVGLFGFGSWAC